MIQRAKRAMKRALASRGYAIERKPRALLDNPHAHLQVTFEHVLGRYLLSHRDFFFVQVGANDGIAYDPINRFVRQRGWQGVLIEPVADYMVALRRNYEGIEGIEFRQVAISNEVGERLLYKVRAAPGLPDWASTLASFSLPTILSHRPALPAIDSLIETETVHCLPLSQIFSELGDRTVDLLQIDVEGLDYMVLQTLDFDRWRPPILHFEHGHLREEELEECLRFLIRHGYGVSQEYRDTTACLLKDGGP
jgi:FkbM family methyltransferase